MRFQPKRFALRALLLSSFLVFWWVVYGGHSNEIPRESKGIFVQEIAGDVDMRYTQFPPNPRAINWKACRDGNPEFPEPDLLCASIELPRDWLQSSPIRSSPKAKSTSTVILPLMMSTAGTSARYKSGELKPMILINPGGPGSSGLDMLVDGLPFLRAAIGEGFNIIAFDPRGTGRSFPTMTCHNRLSHSSLQRIRKLVQELQVLEPSLSFSLFEKKRRTYSTVAKICSAIVRDDQDHISHHMSSASVATDMLAITDAYFNGEPDSLSRPVNFWGLSYGSFLGATFAAMYPERVGRFVLDGVVIPEKVQNLAEGSNVRRTDAEFYKILNACKAAGRERCMLNVSPGFVHNTSESWFEDFLKSAEHRFEQRVSLGLPGCKVRADAICARIKESLTKDPWSEGESFTKTLQDFISGNDCAFKKSAAAVGFSNGKYRKHNSKSMMFESLPSEYIGLSRYLAIFCTDGHPPTVAADDIPSIQKEYSSISKVDGGLAGLRRTVCSYWSISSPYRFGGSFEKVNTANAVLFVGNEFNPVSPLASAEQARRSFPNSGILKIDSVGHCSSSLPPKEYYDCVAVAPRLREYFESGKLPENLPENFPENTDKQYHCVVDTGSIFSPDE